MATPQPELRLGLSPPVPLTSFVGREREVAQVCALLRREDVRLLTLTGPGGVGKTRLALAAATAVTAEPSPGLEQAFADGLRFIPLAAVRDHRLVASVLAHALDVRETGALSFADPVRAAARDIEALLLLDNFEHLLPAGPLLTELLAACPRLTLLVTSRERLHLSGEWDLPVHPLACPDPERLPSTEQIAAAPAVCLFIERVQAVDPDFALTDANAAAVAAICHRLDGLPLALELAAARSPHLPPAALLPRLARRLPLLTGGPRDVPARLRTMRDAIAWSHDLLIPQEQALFRRLAVFAGGFTLDAAEQMMGDGEDVLEGIASLVDQSLLRRQEAVLSAALGAGHPQPRFAMLETIRELAQELLEASGEAVDVRRVHAAHYLRLAEQGVVGPFGGPDETAWLGRLDPEHGNLRAALGWLEQSGDVDGTLQLAVALGRFWRIRGHISEGQDWLERSLARHRAAPPALRARAMDALGALGRDRGDYERARALYEQSLPLHRAAGDRRRAAQVLNALSALAYDEGDFPTGQFLTETALALQREEDDRWGTARSLHNLGWIAVERGDLTAARSRLAESLAIWRALGDQEGTGRALLSLGVLAAAEGDHAAAWSLLTECLALWRAVGHQIGVAESLCDLAAVALAQGEPGAAAPLLAEGLAIYRDAGIRFRTAEALEVSAGLAVACSEPARALRWAGSAAALREATGILPGAIWTERLAGWIEVARRPLDAAAADAAWAAGRALSAERAIAEAAAFAADVSVTAAPSGVEQAPGAGLTPRELDVLRLVVAGQSDRAIADALFISRRTASKHVAAILAKLGVASRAEAAARAVRDGLA